MSVEILSHAIEVRRESMARVSFLMPESGAYHSEQYLPRTVPMDHTPDAVRAFAEAEWERDRRQAARFNFFHRTAAVAIAGTGLELILAQEDEPEAHTSFVNPRILTVEDVRSKASDSVVRFAQGILQNTGADHLLLPADSTTITAHNLIPYRQDSERYSIVNVDFES